MILLKCINIVKYFSDAESLDSGMSLTNTLDMRHADPEFKVKRTNERTKERTNEQTNERTNERMNE